MRHLFCSVFRGPFPGPQTSKESRQQNIGDHSAREYCVDEIRARKPAPRGDPFFEPIHEPHKDAMAPCLFEWPSPVLLNVALFCFGAACYSRQLLTLPRCTLRITFGGICTMQSAARGRKSLKHTCTHAVLQATHCARRILQQALPIVRHSCCTVDISACELAWQGQLTSRRAPGVPPVESDAAENAAVHCVANAWWLQAATSVASPALAACTPRRSCTRGPHPPRIFVDIGAMQQLAGQLR